MDKIDAMKVFIQVAETGSFTRAAEGLGLPRATVSAAVQQLEADLGTRLLHRTTRQVQLSLDGSMVLERSRQIVADMEEVENLFVHSPAQISGKLRVDVPGRMGHRLIAPALPDFFRRYPRIELELGSTDRPVDLIQEGVDCAIRGGTLSDSSLIARPMGNLRQIQCASPGYLAAHSLPVSIDDLSQQWAVNYAVPTSGRVLPWEFNIGGQRRSLTMKSRVTVNNAETYIACALAGMGLIQIPEYDVRDQLESGALVEVLPQARALPLPVFALYPTRRHLSQRVRAFIDWMDELLHPYVEPEAHDHRP